MYKVKALKKKFAKTFTEPGSPGSIYRGLFERLEEAMRAPVVADGGAVIDPRLLNSDGVHYVIIPAFFHTLLGLTKSGRDFTVVIRTFGTDGPEIAAAINAFAEGKHPLFDFAAAGGEEGGGGYQRRESVERQRDSDDSSRFHSCSNVSSTYRHRETRCGG